MLVPVMTIAFWSGAAFGLVAEFSVGAAFGGGAWVFGVSGPVAFGISGSVVPVDGGVCAKAGVAASAKAVIASTETRIRRFDAFFIFSPRWRTKGVPAADPRAAAMAYASRAFRA
jgi:hypothetical protein